MPCSHGGDANVLLSKREDDFLTGTFLKVNNSCFHEYNLVPRPRALRTEMRAVKLTGVTTPILQKKLKRAGDGKVGGGKLEGNLSSTFPRPRSALARELGSAHRDHR